MTDPKDSPAWTLIDALVRLHAVEESLYADGAVDASADVRRALEVLHRAIVVTLRDPADQKP